MSDPTFSKPLSRRRLLQNSVFTAAGGLALSVNAQTAGTRIRIGQIGTGHAHAAGKMEVYRASPDYEVVGLVEPDPERAKKAAASATYRDIPQMTREQLLNTPGLQAVAVETDIADLLDNAEAAIDAGCHVHLDKPAGSSFPDYQRLMKKADAAGLTVQMGYMYRYNPAVVLVRRLLEEGALGTPFECHAVMSKVVPPAGRKELEQYPGGMLFELGCHIVDLTVGFMGIPDEVVAYPRQSLPGADDTLADNMLAVFQYPNATATVRSSAVEVEGFGRRHIALAGTGGTAHIQPLDRPSLRLTLSKAHGRFKKGTQEIPFTPPYQRYVGDAADLAAIIRGEKTSDFPSSHDLAVQKSVLQACALPLT